MFPNPQPFSINDLGKAMTSTKQLPWDTQAAFPYDEVAEFALELGRLAASRLNDETTMAFRSDICRQIQINGSKPYYEAWRDIIDSGYNEICHVLTDTTERGRYLRAVAQFRAFATREERAAMRRRIFLERAQKRLA
jgi:hypothetical protein